MSYFSRLAAILVAFVTICNASEHTCGTDASVYAALNRPLIIRDSNDSKTYSEKEQTSLTEKLLSYLDDKLPKIVGDNCGANPSAIADYIACVQSEVPEYQSWREETSTPVAWRLDTDRDTCAVGLWIYRGGAGVPNLLPIFEIFQADANGWKKIGGPRPELAASTFFIKRIPPPILGQNWFLLYGNRIGDTGVRLHLELMALRDGRLATISDRSEIPKTYVESVQGDTFVLKGAETDARGRQVEFHDKWKIVPSGIEHVDRQLVNPAVPQP